MGLFFWSHPMNHGKHHRFEQALDVVMAIGIGLMLTLGAYEWMAA